MLYPGLDDLEKMKRIAAAGFPLMEFWGWKGKPIDGIAELVSHEGVKIKNFSGQRRGDLIDRETHALVLEDLQESVEVAGKLGTDTLMVLTNELGDGGRVLHPCSHIPGEVKRANVIEGLGKAVSTIPEHMKLVLEPVNSLVDHEGYYIDQIEEAAAIVEEVGDSRLSILCDLYHQAVMGDDLEHLIRTFAPVIGYIHIADCPGRHEPGTGSVDWRSILGVIAACGYEGCVGFEYSPKDDSAESLHTIRELWDDVFGRGH